MCPATQPTTVASVLTPPGVGAIAVLRLVGPRALDILQAVFRPCRGQLGDTPDLTHLRYGRLTDGAEVIDDVIVSLHGGEDGVDAADISVHGGVRVVARILQRLERQGAVVRSSGGDGERANWPASSEVEREADSALSRARTRRAVEFLATQRAVLPAHLAKLARRALVDPVGVLGELKRLAAGWDAVRFLVHGAEVGVVGPANAGKSTLTNRLTGADATLASPHAGTTRDWTIHDTAIDGVPLAIIDTAGLSAPVELDELDAADATAAADLAWTAMARGIDRIRAADLHLLVLDGAASAPLDAASQIVDVVHPRRLLVVVNKSDLGPPWPPARLRDTLSSIAGPGCGTILHVSAKRGDAIQPLREAILRQLGLHEFDPSRASLFTARQAAAAGRAPEESTVDAATVGRVLDQLSRESG